MNRRGRNSLPYCTYEAEGTGLEPTTPTGHLNSNQVEYRRNDAPTQELANDANGQVPILVPSPSETEIAAFLGPELARVRAVWCGLPDAIKSAILALVDTAPKPAGGANA